MPERYVGISKRPELHAAAEQKLSGETARAVGLFLDGKTLADVAASIGRNKKATNDMKVAENIVTGRLVHVTRYALRRTARGARHMLTSDSLGVNSKKQLEYLWDRACEEAARRKYPMAKADQRKGLFHA